MKAVGSLLFIIGLVSTILYFMEYNLKVLSFMNKMNETEQWMVRGGFMLAGIILWMIGNRKPKTT